LTKNGKAGITFKRNESNGQSLKLPCGQCIGCRIRRSKEWAIRCIHEASCHNQNCFVTLTYDDKHIPHDHGLRKSDVQKFLKRLRKRFPGKTIRYYMCGEYGEQFGRPHYHLLLFGFDFPDKKFWQERKEKRFYRSQVLESLWPFGYSSISDVTFESAAYVARYVMKKINGKNATKHYRKTDPETGESFDVQPEYNSMSLKPGIAYHWFNRYSSDVYPEDCVTHKGKKIQTPRYYDKQLEATNPGEYEIIKKRRIIKAQKNAENNTYDRLKTRESITKSKQSLYQRPLK